MGYVYPGVDAGLMQIMVVGGLWGYILYKCYLRRRDINLGGGVLAETFGAVKLTDDSTDKKERELQRIISEMAIASSLKEVPCYVLRNESGINAFVLGKQEFAAMVVTQGAINNLDRDEMSAVVAHEYAHIANKDLKLNMRMLVALGGLNAIDELGVEFIDGSTDTDLSDSNRFDPHAEAGAAFAGFFVGCFLRIVGCTLVFFGNIIKSAFSRKREFLADAKAVQYTRNTWGLASVLDKASDDPTKPALNSVYAGELEHLCLKGPWEGSLFTGWLSNHPAPESRIALIEPHFDVKKRSRERNSDEAKAANNSTNSRTTVPMNPAMDFAALPIQDFGSELALVLSIMLSTSGYNLDKTQANFKQILKAYTTKDLPLRLPDEPGINEEFEKALDSLLQQSALQRQAFIEHIAEIMEHDGICTPEEQRMFDHIAIRLNPPADAA